MKIELESLVVWLPVGLFCANWFFDYFIIKIFWKSMKVGRAMCLQAIAMGSLAYLHFRIDIKRHVTPIIKPVVGMLGGEGAFLIFLGILLFVYFLLTLWEKDVTPEREELGIGKAYRRYVIVSLYLGIVSLLGVSFLYWYKKGSLWEATRCYFWSVMVLVFLIVTGIVIAYYFYCWKTGKLEREWLPPETIDKVD